jgi:outer membrane protein assembly factor BamB
VGISRSGALFRGTRAGDLLWRAAFEPHLHDVAVHGGRVLVASNEGATELDLATGERLRTLDTAGLVPWTCAYGPSGELVVGTRSGTLFCYEPSGEPRWRLDLEGYCKRVQPDGDRFLATGGWFGAVVVDYAEGKVRGQWREGLVNTLENAVIAGGRVYACTYGLQLGVFDERSSELIGIIEPVQDFPKAMALHRAGDRELLLLGGRGGFVQIRELTDDGPRLLRTVYPAAGYGS